MTAATTMHAAATARATASTGAPRDRHLLGETSLARRRRLGLSQATAPLPARPLITDKSVSLRSPTRL